ncbi:MAG TPA: ATP-binding protein [Solirubrobacteraceae bacterium]|nr:ATP-binding protein [Solirubrobacteraceae bacterium]
MAFSPETLESMTAALAAVARLDLDPAGAIDVQVSQLLAFTGAPSLALWTLGAGGQPTTVAAAGDPDHHSAETRVVAEAMLSARGPALVAQQEVLGVRIQGARGPDAALIAAGIESSVRRHQELLTAAAPILAALLDRLRGAHGSRDVHSGPRDAAHGTPSEVPPAPGTDADTPDGAAERLLARLRFDLHDGPQQEVYLLAQDLQLFRDQLQAVIAGNPDEARVLGRLDDLEAQVVAVDAGLRRLSTSAQSPFLLPGTLAEVLAEITDAFARRTGITLRTEITGDLGRLSDSQRVAMLALISEGLTNVGKHSHAATVGISITSEIRGVTVEMRDDGTGFDPEAAMAAATRDGHLGLRGMHDRMSLLGGRTQIESQPGGPTVISAFLPRWPSSP